MTYNLDRAIEEFKRLSGRTTPGYRDHYICDCGNSLYRAGKCEECYKEKEE